MLTATRRYRPVDDHRTWVAARLAALFGTEPAEQSEQPEQPEHAPPERPAPAPDPAGPDDPDGPAPRRRLRPAWLGPVRLDPGRRGVPVLVAVTLVVAGLAGALTWRDRPEVRPVAAATLGSAPRAARPPGRPPASSVQPRTPVSAPPIVVAVAGRVRHPGIVHLARGARVVDAIRAAGGVLPGADIGLLNLARRLGDGEQVVVGLPTPAAAPSAGAPGGAPAPGTPVDLNAATVAQLVALPGVGPVTAQRIVDWRNAHGAFVSVDQLRQVPGIGPAKLARLRDLVTL